MKRLALLWVVGLLFAVGCGESGPYALKYVILETTKGDIEIEVHPDWSPKGAERFLTLVEKGFYDDTAFFRIVKQPGLTIAQVGINGDPKLHARWKDRNIKDESPQVSNTRGAISFANRGSNTRSTQFFLNLGDNGPSLNGQGFAPFAVITSPKGLAVADSLYAGYGDKPDQMRLVAEGNAYLKQDFPRLDYIKKAYIK